MSTSFLIIMILHAVLAATGLFWAWRRGHLKRERFPVESILNIASEDEEDINHDRKR